MKFLSRVSLSLALATTLAPAVAAEQPIAIAIHGGAGTIDRKAMTPEREKAYRDKLAEAVDAGYRILDEGGSSLAAINRAINILEDSPLFNAGRGAVYTYDGQHELDASIMDGRTREAGAVAGVKHIKNPINLARLVMDKSVHVMLSGQGAEEFALQQGMDLISNSYFDTEKRYRDLNKAREKLQRKAGNPDYQANHQALPARFKYGTVGAVAVDRQGNLAAGTSTGGMTAKRFGRIGDSPVIGAGTWADNASCAVSSTGHGEYFIRYQVAADICARVKYKQQDIKTASEAVIFGPMKEAGGTGGVVVVDRQGQVALTFNTKGMYRASKRQGEAAKVAIFR